MSDAHISGQAQLFTIGHSNHKLSHFLELLHLYGVEIVVDTRSRPYSKFVAQYNHDVLKESLATEGFQYLYLGKELGGRPEGNEFYDSAGHVLYDLVMSSSRFQQGLSRLQRGMQQFKIVLLCAEEDPSKCHRRLLIARALRKIGVEVDHIRGNGRLQSERQFEEQEGAGCPQIPLFAQADRYP